MQITCHGAAGGLGVSNQISIESQELEAGVLVALGAGKRSQIMIMGDEEFIPLPGD